METMQEKVIELSRFDNITPVDPATVAATAKVVARLRERGMLKYGESSVEEKARFLEERRNLTPEQFAENHRVFELLRRNMDADRAQSG